MTQHLLSAAGMVAPSIIQPLQPKGPLWVLRESSQTGGELSAMNPNSLFEIWDLPQSGFRAMSAFEVVEDQSHPEIAGPHYHISFSKWSRSGVQSRCDTNDCRWLLRQFGNLDGWEEDNHVPGGKVRNFWRFVDENRVGMECPCKKTETPILEEKGDYVWRPV